MGDNPGEHQLQSVAQQLHTPFPDATKLAQMKKSGMIRESGTKGRAASEMREKGNDAPPITGYLNCISARPEETVVCYASAEEEGSVDVDIVRIVCADPNPSSCL